MKYFLYKISFTISFSTILFAQFNYNLEECISIALGNKKTIQSSKLGLEGARKGVLISRSELLPAISLNYNNSQNRFSEQTTSNFNISDALNGAVEAINCTTSPTKLPNYTNIPIDRQIPSWKDDCSSKYDITLVVSAKTGSPTGTGSIDNPLDSIENALIKCTVKMICMF